MKKIDPIDLRGFAVFRDISEDSLQMVLESSKQEWVPEQAVLLEEGRLSDFLYVIIRGSVDLFTDQGGRESTLTVLHPPRAFVLANVIRELPAAHSARTLETSYILKIPAQVLRHLLETDIAFAGAAARELAVSYGCVTIELKNQKLRTGLERLAHWILRTHTRMGQNSNLVLPFDKRTLASRVGMTPENLSRSLAQLSKSAIRVRGKNLEIRDYNALLEQAHVQTEMLKAYKDCD